MRETIAAILTSIIGLAVVAVLVSKQSNTSQVFASAGLSLGSLIGSAVSPVTGSGNGATSALGNLLGNSTGNLVNGS